MPKIFSHTLSTVSGAREEQLCRVLHIILILLYVALVIVASQHYEHGLNFPFTSTGQTTLSATVSIISQGFGTLYLAGLVLVTQRLALIRDLHTRQTLTAVHDKTSAWLGLGSSLLALVDQIKLPSAVSSVAFISSYLAGIAILHITVPASVSVNTYNGTTMTQQTTQLARPLVYSQDPVSFDILNVYNQFPQIGLQDNMIYDVLPVVPAAVNNTIVNATIFDVKCGVSQNEAQDGQAEMLGDDDIYWPVRMDFRNSSSLNMARARLLPPSSLSVTTISITDFFNTTKFSGLDLNGLPWIILATSTIPVVDTLQTRGGLFEINPGMAWYNESPNGILSDANTKVESIQMFMCNISTINTTVSVSAITRQPVPNVTPSETPMFWEEWSMQDYPMIVQDLLTSDLAGAFSEAPGASHAAVINLNDIVGVPYNTSSLEFIGNTSYNLIPLSRYYSVIDQFLIQDLNLSAAAPHPPSSILLSDFQRSLGKAMAAIVWYDRNGDHSSMFSYGDPALGHANEARIGQAMVEVLTLRIRLNFNIIALAVGLGISCLLFALTFPLSGGLKRHEITNDLDAAGILQLTWLLGNESRFAGSRRPDRQELRQAGLFDVQVSNWAEQKFGRNKSDFDSLEDIALNGPHAEYDEV